MFDDLVMISGMAIFLDRPIVIDRDRVFDHRATGGYQRFRSHGCMSDRIDIAFCIDDTMALPLSVALLSMAASRRRRLRVHLLVDRATRAAPLLRDILDFIGFDHILAEGAPEQDLAPEGHTPYGRPSTAPYRRILLADRFPGLDRLLYLDADILVRDDLGDLWDVDLAGKPVGAVVEAAFDPGEAWMAHYAGGYFNSGVLLIDLRRWRAEGLTAQVADRLAARRRVLAEAKAQEVTTDPATALWGEQTPLNEALIGRWRPLPPRWNLTKEFDSGHGIWPGFSDEAIAATIGNPGLFHFAGAEKPWVPAYAGFTTFHREFQSWRGELERRFDLRGLTWPGHDDPGLRLACRVMALQLVQQAREQDFETVVLAGKPLWIAEIAQVARRKGLTIAALATQSALHQGGVIDGIGIVAVRDALAAGQRDFIIADVPARCARLKAEIAREAAAQGIIARVVEPEERPHFVAAAELMASRL
jgi:lipopolysaccharide biosynthesis glycosyltransferase